MGALSGLEFAGFAQRDILADLRELAFNYLNKYTQRQGKTRWVEKTAFDIYHLNEIELLCEDQVTYLGILRHPLDVAVSSKEFCDAAGMYPREMHTYIQSYSQPIEAFVQSWIDTTQALIELGKNRPENCIICRYEDLVEEPRDTLTDLLNFLGEDFEEVILTKAFQAGDTLGFSDHKSYQAKEVHRQSVEKWRSLPAQQIAQMAEKVNPLLELCGYDLIDGYTVKNAQESRRRYLNSLMINANQTAK